MDRFRVVYEAHYSAIHAFLLRRLGGCHADAADIAAEVFAIAWRRVDQMPLPPEDRLWLFGVARRVLNRHRRSLWRHSRLLRRLEVEASVLVPIDDPPTGALTAQERVRTAVNRLKPADREVLRLVLWDQLSHFEAAYVLGCSTNAVGLRLQKAKARLRHQLTLDQATDTSTRLPDAKASTDDEL
jgi:RNA polymerase sigma-70 factor (ECF subfamily)